LRCQTMSTPTGQARGVSVGSPSMRRTFKYRLYPSKAQIVALFRVLLLLRELYNAALQHRRDAWQKQKVSITFGMQSKSLKEVREAREDIEDLHFHLLQDVVLRLDLAFEAFFDRVKKRAEQIAAGVPPKKAIKVGYPRFKVAHRYRTFTFKDAGNHNGAKLCAGDKRLYIAGVGKVKIKLHRPIEGTLKTVGITFDRDGHWYALLSCDHVPTKPLPATGQTTGVDLGITTFAALSHDDPIENERPLVTVEAALKRAQRKVSRRKKGSHRRRKAGVLLGKRHAKVARVRRDFHHKEARKLVRRYDTICVEDLNVQGLCRGWLAKHVHDAGWGQFLGITNAKAEEAARSFVPVNPSGTSQECSGCQATVPKDLSVRVHRCPHCGLVLDRDVNAARNIERRGLVLLATTAGAPPSGRRGKAGPKRNRFGRRPADDPRSPDLSR